MGADSRIRFPCRRPWFRDGVSWRGDVLMTKTNKRLARVARIWQTEAEFQAELSRIYRDKGKLERAVVTQRKAAVAAEKARDAVRWLGLST